MKAGFGTTLPAGVTAVDDTNRMFTGVAQGDKGTDPGSWTGQFFGEVTDDDANTADVDETVYPSGVGGSFTAHFVNGHVLGGFGAAQDKK